MWDRFQKGPPKDFPSHFDLIWHCYFRGEDYCMKILLQLQMLHVMKSSPCLWLIKVSWNWDPKLYLFTIPKIMKTTHCNHRCFRNELHCAECRLVYRFLITILPKFSKHHGMNERIIKSRAHVSHFFYFKKKYVCALLIRFWSWLLV